MPSYTASLRLVQPSTGEYSGTWGTQVNNGITALVDASIAGTTSITMTAANYTLTTANGASDESRAMFLVIGGTPGAAREVIVPAVSKLYFVTNNTTGGFAQTVKTASGSGISVPNGARMTLRCDGTDVVVAQNYFASLTLGSALPVASGGTGLTAFGTGVATALGQNVTGSGSIVLATGPTVSAPTINSGYTEATATANTGTAYTIDLANGSLQILTLTGNCTFTFPTPTAGRSFMLLLRQDATGGRTVTWPGTVRWPSSINPVITTTASKTDKFVFTADGTNWLGSNGGQNY